MTCYAWAPLVLANLIALWIVVALVLAHSDVGDDSDVHSTFLAHTVSTGGLLLVVALPAGVALAALLAWEVLYGDALHFFFPSHGMRAQSAGNWSLGVFLKASAAFLLATLILIVLSLVDRSHGTPLFVHISANEVCVLLAVSAPILSALAAYIVVQSGRAEVKSD